MSTTAQAFFRVDESASLDFDLALSRSESEIEDSVPPELLSQACSFMPLSYNENVVYDEIDLPDQVIFNGFLDNWHKERGATSSITEMAMCPSYQKIIGMGRKVVPLILHQLIIEGEEPDMWFWALCALTSADPVTDEMRGDFSKMAEAWLNWGRVKQYVW